MIHQQQQGRPQHLNNSNSTIHFTPEIKHFFGKFLRDIELTITAWRSVKVLLPTDVPKALATSLAPARTENDKINTR